MTTTPDTNEERSNTTVEVRRADALTLGDTFLRVQPLTGAIVTDRVERLAMEGDDVVINGALTTSKGNTFHVVDARF